MKIRIIIKENFDKIYNILGLIKKNKYLSKNVKNIQYFNETNWQKIFDKTVKDVLNKKFEKVCIFDNEGILPFIFFSKQRGLTCSIPLSIEKASLSRAHNNANCIVMPCKYLKKSNINNILNVFFTTKPDGGRHNTRIKLMQAPFKKSKKIHSFDSKKKNTVLICSDHAGFALKQKIKDYLINKKHLHVIDVGCSSSNSTHYPLFAIALVQEAKKAFCGIGICSTGFGIANTFNKFKGINAFVSLSSDQSKIARSKYNTNVLVLGAKDLNLKSAVSAVDKFLKTPLSKTKVMVPMNNYGYEFDFNKFKKIPLNPQIEIPKELLK